MSFIKFDKKLASVRASVGLFFVALWANLWVKIPCLLVVALLWYIAGLAKAVFAFAHVGTQFAIQFGKLTVESPKWKWRLLMPIGVIMHVHNEINRFQVRLGMLIFTVLNVKAQPPQNKK